MRNYFSKNILLIFLILFPIIIFVLSRFRAYTVESTAPKLSLVDVVNLGERDLGEKIVSPLTITNNGNSDLVLDDQRSSCACSGLCVKENNVLSLLEKAVVDAGSSRTFYIQVTATGLSGQPRQHILDLRTNDPQFPRKQIQVSISKIRAGPYTQPSSLLFGKVNKGEKISKTIEVRHPDSKTLRLQQAVSNDRRITVRLLPTVEKANKDIDPRNDHLSGLIEVSIDTSTAGEINSIVQLLFTEKPTGELNLPVHGIIQEEIVAFPTVILLPKTTESGLQYKATVRLSASDGSLFFVSKVTSPKMVQVTSQNDEVPSQAHQMQITLGEDYSSDEPQEHILHFDCRKAESGNVITMKVKLILQPKGRR
ncbi:MAG: hypothetical protein JNJ77_16015 [Planctomycetia bacterium]|nr:hypothetical protein [Planctomycetia bacterium]